MLDWLFKPQPVANGYSREVTVTSSRYATKIYTVYGDLPVDAIDAIRIVEANLSDLEAGESREIKVYL